MLSATPILINALRSLIIKFSPEESNSLGISDDNTSLLKEKLLIIKTSCEQLNKKDAKKALNELRQKTWTKDINAALDEITAHLLHSEFGKAAETAQQAASAL